VNISPRTGGTSNMPLLMLTGTGESTQEEWSSPGTCSANLTTKRLRLMVTATDQDTGNGFPNLVWALGWEGHAGLHFFTRLPKSVTNPFLSALPDGFIVKRRWYGQAGDHWNTTHDVRCTDGVIHKRVYMVGSGFKKGSCMMWDGDRSSGAPWIVNSFPQYVVAIPKGDDHIWYRSTFQFQLNNGSYYSGYWEMDIHLRKNIKMPSPFVVKFWDESWYSNAFSWQFYEREEVEHSTYDSD